MKLELYAPVDCEVKSIDQSSDSVFAEKMLGEGILILPKNDTDEFKSPFLNAKVAQVFDTNHAMWFSIEDVNALIHCGLETVTLNGKPFNVKVKVDQLLTKDDTLFNVDWGFIKNEKLSCETPIVFEEKQDTKIEINILKAAAKQGEKIAEVTFSKTKKVVKENVDQTSDNFEIKTFKNKYRKTAETIHRVLGEGNYKNVYHCMTRFRANIIDKERVDVDILKKIDIVKGVQYNASEIQIIIGGEVTKVFDEFQAYEAEPKTKENFEIKTVKNNASVGKKILAGVAGIVGPTIPAIMASGIFGAIFAILLQAKLVTNLSDVGQIKDADMLSGLIFVLNKVILNGLGVMFLFNFVKYFNGETMYALGVGLILSSRAFFPGTGMTDDAWAAASFGDWISHGGKQGYLLFKLGEMPIVAGGYEGSVLPYIAAGALLVYINKFVKMWMPSVIDIVFRPTLVIGVTLLGTWLLFGPLMGLIEYGIVTALTQAGKLPGGIGVGIMALVWQPLVLTGSHVGVAMPLVVAMANGEPQALMNGIHLGTWAQVGAVLGVAFATKNYTVKSLAYGSVVGGVFGVTEPIIYGVNLPRVKPFLLGCLAAFPAGMVSGITGVDADGSSGVGIFGIFAFQDGVGEQALALLSWTIAASLAGVLTYFTNSERKNEYKETKKVINMLTLAKVSKKNKAEFKSQLEGYEVMFKDDLENVKKLKQLFKEYENQISNQTKFESALVSLENKESIVRGKKYKQLLKLRSKLLKNPNSELEAKFNKLNNEYEAYNLDSTKEEINNKITTSKKDFQVKLEELRVERNKISDDFNSKIPTDIDKDKIEFIKNQIWNAMHTVEIGFGMEDERTTKVVK